MESESVLIPIVQLVQYLGSYLLHVEDEVWVFDLEGVGCVLDGTNQHMFSEGCFTDVLEGKHLIIFVKKGLFLLLIDVAEDARHSLHKNRYC